MGRPQNPPSRLLNQYEIHPNFTRRKYYYESFLRGAQPIYTTINATTGVSAFAAIGAAATNATINMMTPGGYFWELRVNEQADIFPLGAAAKGLNITGDLTDNDSKELVPGGNLANSPFAFTTGTDSDFFIRATIEIADASTSDQFLVGFRKQAAYGNPTSFLSTGDAGYTDYCGIGFAGTKAAANPVRVSYDLNDSGSATVKDTNFTWADGKVHQLEMRVVGRKAYFRINGYRLGAKIAKDALGAAITSQSTYPTADGVFTFDSGDVLVPFIFLRHDVDISTADFTYLRDIEIGHLSDIGE